MLPAITLSLENVERLLEGAGDVLDAWDILRKAFSTDSNVSSNEPAPRITSDVLIAMFRVVLKCYRRCISWETFVIDVLRQSLGLKDARRLIADLYKSFVTWYCENEDERQQLRDFGIYTAAFVEAAMKLLELVPGAYRLQAAGVGVVVIGAVYLFKLAKMTYDRYSAMANVNAASRRSRSAVTAALVQKAAEAVVTRQRVHNDLECTEGTKRLVCRVVYPEETRATVKKETQDRVDTFYECSDDDITNHVTRASSSPSRKLKLDVSAINVSHDPEVRFAAVYKRASNDKQAKRVDKQRQTKNSQLGGESVSSRGDEKNTMADVLPGQQIIATLNATLVTGQTRAPSECSPARVSEQVKDSVRRDLLRNQMMSFKECPRPGTRNPRAERGESRLTRDVSPVRFTPKLSGRCCRCRTFSCHYDFTGPGGTYSLCRTCTDTVTACIHY